MARTKTAARLAAETQRKILAAAGVVFSRAGYEGATMEAIAKEAGVDKPHLYHYFAGKDALYRALIEHILIELVGQVRDYLLAPAASPWQRVDDLLDILFRVADSYRGLMRLAFDALLHGPGRRGRNALIASMFDQIEALAQTLLQEGIDRGEFAPMHTGQAVLTFEGAVFMYFLQPEERLLKLTGGKMYDRQSLLARKQALRAHLRGMLAARA